MKALSLGSLFSGIGGFEVAAERLGMRVAWSCEIDPFGRKVLAKHWPGVELYEDVRAIEPARTERVDILTGGFPCQDLSVAGKRAGLAGERSGLFWEIVRLADALRPRWLVLENVPGLLSSEGGQDMGMVVGALRDLGYLGAWRVLDAQWFGVAQRRRRVFLVGCLGGDRLAALLPFLASGNGHPAPRREAGKIAPVCPTLRTSGGGFGTDFDCDGGLIAPPLTRNPYGDHESREGLLVPQIAHALCSRTAKGGDPTTDTYCIQNGARPREYSQGLGRSRGPAYTLDCNGEHAIVHTLRGEGFDASKDGTGRGTPLVLQEAQTGVRLYETCGTLRSDAPGSQPCGSLVAFTAEATPKHGVECCPALDSVGSRRPTINGSSVRRLTPTECERLQGFSWRDAAGGWQDGHTCLCGRNRGRSAGEEPCKCPDGPRYRALGNAVAVPCVEWILRRTLDAERMASHA